MTTVPSTMVRNCLVISLHNPTRQTVSRGMDSLLWLSLIRQRKAGIKTELFQRLTVFLRLCEFGRIQIITASQNPQNSTRFLNIV